MYIRYTYTPGRFDKAAPEIYVLCFKFFILFLYFYIWVKYKTYIHIHVYE